MTDSTSDSEFADQTLSRPVFVTYPQDAEKTVDLLEVILILWRHKWLILAMTFVFAGLGVLYSILATPIYRSEAVLIPNSGPESSVIPGNLGGLANLAGIDMGSSSDTTEAVAMLRSRVLIEELIDAENLLPVLFADRWDAATEQWILEGDDLPPTNRQGVELFIDEVRTVSEDVVTGIVTIGIEWTDPGLTTAWTDILIRDVNARLQSRDMENAQRRLEYLRAQLESVNLVELREVISTLIEGEIQTLTLAQANEEYAFKVIDPPRVPERPVAPRPLLVVAAATILGAALGVIIALLLATFRRIDLSDDKSSGPIQTPVEQKEQTGNPDPGAANADSGAARPRIISSKT